MKKMQNDTERVTNLEYLLSLAKGNTQFVNEMIGIFLSENPREILALKSAIEKKDFEMIKQSAHLLQSSIAFVGLNKLIELEVYQIEKLAAEEEALKKIEITPPDKTEFQKIEIVMADKDVVRKIENLFEKVKVTCEKCCSELKQMDNGIQAA